MDDEPLLNEPPSLPRESREDIQFAEDQESEERDDETLYDEPMPPEVLQEAQSVHMVDEDMILSPTPSSEFQVPTSRGTSWLTSVLLLAIGFAGGVGWSAVSGESSSSEAPGAGAVEPAVVDAGASAIPVMPTMDTVGGSEQLGAVGRGRDALPRRGGPRRGGGPKSAGLPCSPWNSS